jgi:hypothetical protein
MKKNKIDNIKRGIYKLLEKDSVVKTNSPMKNRLMYTQNHINHNHNMHQENPHQKKIFDLLSDRQEVRPSDENTQRLNKMKDMVGKILTRDIINTTNEKEFYRNIYSNSHKKMYNVNPLIGKTNFKTNFIKEETSFEIEDDFFTKSVTGKKHKETEKRTENSLIVQLDLLNLNSRATTNVK